jgi:hypothetical protein
VLQACQVGGAIAVESHVLFQEAEQVLNREPPQLHAAQVLRSNLLQTHPEEPERLLAAWCAIFIQKLYTDN